MSYLAGYQPSVFKRFMRSVFIEAPAQVWFRVLSLLTPGGQFANYSGVSDAVLMAAWFVAQKNLSANPFPQNTGGTDMHPADPRAMTIYPSHVAVISVPDVPISDLIKVDPGWHVDADPSGAILIMVSGFMEYTTCHAVTFCWTRPRVYAAASKIPVVLSYEFENIILSKLGYNVEGR